MGGLIDPLRFVFLGGSQYSLRILLSILQDARSELVYFVFDDLDRESSEWRAVSSGVPDIERRLVSAEAIQDITFIGTMKTNQVQLALSVNFMHRIGPSFLGAFPLGCLNLHPSFLPYNRGTWPELWSIIEGTPSGISLHYMDEGIDTGPVVDQTRVHVTSFDTGATLCSRIEDAGVALIQKHWPALRESQVSGVSQPFKTRLRTDKERLQLEQLNLAHIGTLNHHLDILRALTLDPFIRGGWYIDRETGKRVRVTVTFELE